ncbi:hypothetical protein GALMADRAFT_237783 [Galerina marginata CBS 339.88]|uniref:Phytocyanin domain-containing protein n=1 Tax=Galerina marginata (strain CBS 339.88) TaxID=685588 RepID=A0A067TH75_GALM3|nr:hypothetical protein GALMADRAFT_237783 [Galerina marginata CBS 339.88]
MRFSTTLVAAVSAFASVASAANLTVTVGKDATNVFEPNVLTGVQAGDTISFKFVSKNHTLTQSTFATPCVAKPNGVNSGFIPVAAGATTFPTWTIQVDNVTAPLWFYCAQAQHCKGGMVFAINPTADKTFDTYLATAKGSSPPANPSSPGGAATPPASPSAGSPSGSGSASTPSSPASGAFTVSIHKATTLLAALGVVAGLTL